MTDVQLQEDQSLSKGSKRRCRQKPRESGRGEICTIHSHREDEDEGKDKPLRFLFPLTDPQVHNIAELRTQHCRAATQL